MREIPNRNSSDSEHAICNWIREHDRAMQDVAFEISTSDVLGYIRNECDLNHAEKDLLLEWVRIKYIVADNPVVGFTHDSKKSLLLQRMLRNGFFYPHAPPRCNGYPWYELLENKRYRGFLSVYNKGKNSIVIGGSFWKIKSPGIVCYNSTEGSLWSLKPFTKDEAIAYIQNLNKHNLPPPLKRDDPILNCYYEISLLKPGKNHEHETI